MEAFSDGVFAVAIALLALDVHVPKLDALPPGGLGLALLALWPSLLAYVTSFATILIMWLNPDRLFEQIQRKDHLLLIFSGLLLALFFALPPRPVQPARATPVKLRCVRLLPSADNEGRGYRCNDLDDPKTLRKTVRPDA